MNDVWLRRHSKVMGKKDVALLDECLGKRSQDKAAAVGKACQPRFEAIDA